MSDQTQNQSSEVEQPINAPEDLSTKSLEELEKMVQEAAVTPQDQEEEKSSELETDSSAETTEQTVAGKKETEPSKEDTQEKVTQEVTDFEKKYKALEPEFTRRSQELSKLRKEVDELKAKLVKPSTETSGQDADTASPLDKLAETNPAAKTLVEALRAEIATRLGKELRPVKEQLTQKQATDNVERFTKELADFEKSELGGLKAELDAVAGEYFENQDAVLQAAASDSALFTKLKKEVISRNFIKAAELMKPKPSIEQRNKEIANTGVMGKSKTVQAVEDKTDFDVFKKLPLAEQEAILKKLKVI